MTVSKHPIIGLNQDDDENNLKPGWCREIWNMLPKNGYSKTAAENTLGTVIRTNGSLAAGTNTCIGAFTDSANNRIFYFLYNSNLNHSIWYFLPDSNTHVLVLQTPFHNFSLSFPILSCDFMEDLMEYTDGNNECRSLIVDRAVNSGYSFSTQSEFEQQISLHKVRPELPPTADRSAGVVGFNNTGQDSYQFCFQYVFYDNSVSRISPLSTIAKADTFPSSPGTGNLTRVTCRVKLSIEPLIKKIYFIYVKNGDGNYWLFKEGSFNPSDPDYIAPSGFDSTHLSLFIDFAGNETAQNIVINNVNQIPNKSNNIMVHNQRSYITLNEFDYAGWDGSISAVKSALTTASEKIFPPNSTSTIGVIFYDEFGRTNGVTKETTVTFGSANLPYPSYTPTFASASNLLAITWTLSGTPPPWARTYAIVLKRTNTYENIFSFLALPMFYKHELSGDVPDNEFEDGGKVFQETPPTVWTNPVYWKIPLNMPFVVDGNYKVRLVNTLTGATHFTEDIISIYGDQIVTSGGFGVSNWQTALGGVTFGLVWLQLELAKQTQDEEFFEVGQNYDCSSGTLSVLSGQIFGEYWNTSSKFVYKPFTQNDCSYLNITLGYREIFFELGTKHNFPIQIDTISKSPTHSSVKLETVTSSEVQQNKTANIVENAETAAGNIFPGWVGLAKATHTNLPGNIASVIDKNNPFGTTTISSINQVFALDFNKACSDFGRASINVKNKKVSRQPNTICISDPYVLNSKINGLFDYQIVFEIPINRTPIVKLVNIAHSNIFLAVHKRKTTSFGTYSGDNILHTTAGTQLLGDGKSIIGYDNELRGDYGTIYPDSVVSDNGRVYFFDAYAGEVVRYAGNGLTPLASTYKMKNFFRQKGNQFIDTTGRNVIAGYDGKLDMLYMTFLSAVPEEQITVVFIDRDGEERWYCFTDFIPEQYAQINDRLFGFLSGQMWEFNQNSTRNLFFGVQYHSRVTHLMNQEYSHEKMLMNVGLESNKRWIFDSITVKKNGVDQETSLAKSNFTQRDDVFYADVKRDKNTAVGLLPVGKSALVAGQPMIGKVYVVTMVNDDTELVELNFLNYGYTPQSGHNII